MHQHLARAASASLSAILLLSSTQILAQQICDVQSLQAMPVVSVGDAIARYKVGATAKDEFESTAAYEARINAARTGLPSGPILVSIPNASITKYDADTGLVTVSPYSISTTCLVNEYTLSAEMKAVRFGVPARSAGSAYCLSKVVRSSESGAYQATNGYGARVTVEKSHIYSEGIFFGMGDYGQQLVSGRERFSSAPLFSFPATVSEAKSLKANSRILLLVQPIAPFTGSGSFYEKPTFDSPREVFYNSKFLVADPLCVAIGDSLSGRVFSALPAN